MKKFLTLLIVSLFSSLLPASPPSAAALPIEANALEGNELRAVWVATIGGIDWPRTYATSAETIEIQKREFTNMLDKLQLIGINTILLQTRVRATTIYPSAIEPWDGCMSGKPGMSPGYDPLAFAIEECHRRKMEIQAWVVTIPIGKWNALGCTQLRKKYPNAVVKIGAEGYLNPEKSQTADILCNICAELTRNYNLDGIHLDYIRYPENWKQKVNKSQGRRNITNLVRRIHNTVKAIKPQMKLSCSPLGKNGDLARYSSRGWNCLNTVMQEPQAWLREGLMDQLFPMLYFKENNFYPFAIDWKEQAPTSSLTSSITQSYQLPAPLCPPSPIAAGLAVYCLDRKEGNWPLSEIVRQLNVCRQLGIGQCFFRAKFLLDNVKGIYDFLRLFNHDAPVLCLKYEKESPTKPQAIPPKTNTPPDFLPNDGKTLTLPLQADADLIVIESIAGNALTTKSVRAHKADISSLPEGVYIVRSLHRKGITHRIGMFQIKRR